MSTINEDRAATVERLEAIRADQDKRAQIVALMLVLPPTTRPMCSGIARPLTPGPGIATSPQSRSVPRLVNH